MKKFFNLIFAVFIVFMFIPASAEAETYNINDEIVVSIDNINTFDILDNQIIKSIEKNTVKPDHTYVNYGTLGNVLINIDAIDNDFKSLIKGHTRVNRLGYSANIEIKTNIEVKVKTKITTNPGIKAESKKCLFVNRYKYPLELFSTYNYNCNSTNSGYLEDSKGGLTHFGK